MDDKELVGRIVTAVIGGTERQARVVSVCRRDVYLEYLLKSCDLTGPREDKLVVALDISVVLGGISS